VQRASAERDAGACGAKTPTELIAAARSGCSHSLGELSERYRRYLLTIARGSLNPALRVKVGPSDLVQETLLHVQAKFERFDGTNEEQLLNWMRRILYFRALQVARKFGGTVARDVRRELSIQTSDSGVRVPPLADPALTPRAEMLAREQFEDLNAALARLSADERRVIQLRNVDRQSFEMIGVALGCTAEAARKRWVRALAELRAQLDRHE
jgi:RNA polymerase sigma-70 factor (ECF subfamily)